VIGRSHWQRIDLDKADEHGLIGSMIVKIVTAFACLLITAGAAAAMVGGAATTSKSGAERHLVLIVGSHGTSCTGTAIAPDLVLTAAHCALPGPEYRIVEFDASHRPVLKMVTTVARHPRFDLASLLAHRATADVALMRLAGPLPAGVTPAPLDQARAPIMAGDQLVVAGFGVTVRGDGRTGGTARVATLAVTGHPGNLQIRLVDPATNGERAGLGACTGDSGAPAFTTSADGLAVVGVVSWSTGPSGTGGCGGLTGITPLALYRDWIDATARALGSPL